MSGEEIINYLVNPDLLDTITVRELQEMLSDYPSFELLRMLYVKNLYVNKDIRYRGELRKAALLLSDRSLLFHLIYSFRSPFSSLKNDSHGNVSEEDRTLMLIDHYISTLPSEEQEMKEWNLEMATLSDLWTELEQIPNEPDVVPMKGQHLIDRFIESEPTSQALLQDCNATEIVDEVVVPPIFEDSLSNSEAYFTETLAGIYIKQGRYQRALEIIRKLYLNYPEKSSYFAEQIRCLENLIIANDKKQQ